MCEDEGCRRTAGEHGKKARQHRRGKGVRSKMEVQEHMKERDGDRREQGLTWSRLEVLAFDKQELELVSHKPGQVQR